jgi:hypothetical protein
MAREKPLTRPRNSAAGKDSALIPRARLIGLLIGRDPGIDNRGRTVRCLGVPPLDALPRLKPLPRPSRADLGFGLQLTIVRIRSALANPLIRPDL